MSLWERDLPGPAREHLHLSEHRGQESLSRVLKQLPALAGLGWPCCSLGNADIWKTRRLCTARRDLRFDISLKWRFRLEAFPPQGCLDGSASPLVLQMVITALKNEL